MSNTRDEKLSLEMISSVSRRCSPGICGGDSLGSLSQLASGIHKAIVLTDKYTELSRAINISTETLTNVVTVFVNGRVLLYATTA